MDPSLDGQAHLTIPCDIGEYPSVGHLSSTSLPIQYWPMFPSPAPEPELAQSHATVILLPSTQSAALAPPRDTSPIAATAMILNNIILKESSCLIVSQVLFVEEMGGRMLGGDRYGSIKKFQYSGEKEDTTPRVQVRFFLK
jgi:hypothetical protein